MFSLIPIVKFSNIQGTDTTDTDINKVLPIPIYMDDSISSIKEKLTLYVSETHLMFPPFLAISLSLGNEEITFTEGALTEGSGRTGGSFESMSPVGILDSMDIQVGGGNVVLVVTNLIDELAFAGGPESIYSQTTKGDNLYFNQFKKKYIDLREDYFNLALKIALYKVDSVIYSHFEGDIQSSMEDVLVDMTRISTAITQSYKNLGDYINASKDPQLSIYSNPRDFVITNVNYTVDLKRNIDLVKIFNTFELSNDVPFLGIGGQYINKENPVVRLFKKDNQVVINEREIRDFYISENIKQGIVSYKKVRGLMFKVRIPESTSYGSILFNEKGLIVINMKPNKTAVVVNEILENRIRDLIIKVRGGVNHIVFNLVNLSVNIETDTFIDTEQLSIVTKRPSISKFLFELKDILSKELISLLYKKSYKDITINIKDNPYSPNSSVVSILGVRGMWQILTLLTQLSILDNLFYDTKMSPVVRQQLKERSNIKRLKELGVKVKSTNCQKQRQPIIVDPSVKTPQLIGDSYPVVHEGNVYICTTKEYPYPGFTNENILCCFKKDQRNKEAFLRNTGTGTDTTLGGPSKKDAKKHIITTEKLLENGRLGLLPQIFRQSIENTLKIKNMFRLGVLQDRNSFLNAVSAANDYSDTTIFWTEFREFIKNNKTLLELYIDKTLIESTGSGVDDVDDVDFFIKEVQKDYLLAISYFTQTNYYVFDIDHLDCTVQSITDNYSDYVILLKRDNNWEILVEKSDEQIVKKLKNDHPLVQFMGEYYNASCKKMDYLPQSYPYKKLPYLKDILSKTPIQTQIVNENNMVSFVVDKSGGLIPVRDEQIKLGIPYKWFNEIQFSSIDIQEKTLTGVGQNPLGLIIKDGDIVGILSNTGVMTPVKQIKETDYNGKLKPTRSPLGNYIIKDNESSLKWERRVIDNPLDDLRRAFADYLTEVNEDLRDDILQIVTNTKTNHKQKFMELLNIIPENFKNKTMINELIVENKFSNILNDNIPSKFVEMKSSTNEEILYL